MKIVLILFLVAQGVRLVQAWMRARQDWNPEQDAEVDADVDAARWPALPADTELRIEDPEGISVLRLVAPRTGNEIFGAACGWGGVVMAVWVVVTWVLRPDDLPALGAIFFLGLILSVSVPLLLLESRIVCIERSLDGLRFVRRFGGMAHFGRWIPAARASRIRFSVALQGALGMTITQDRPFVFLDVHRQGRRKTRYLMSCRPTDGQWIALALEGWRAALRRRRRD